MSLSYTTEQVSAYLRPLFDEGLSTKDIIKHEENDPDYPFLKKHRKSSIETYRKRYRQEIGASLPVPKQFRASLEERKAKKLREQASHEAEKENIPMEEPTQVGTVSTPSEEPVNSMNEQVRTICEQWPELCGDVKGVKEILPGLSNDVQGVKAVLAELQASISALSTPPAASESLPEPISQITKEEEEPKILLDAPTVLQYFSGHAPDCPDCQGKKEQIIRPAVRLLQGLGYDGHDFMKEGIDYERSSEGRHEHNTTVTETAPSRIEDRSIPDAIKPGVLPEEQLEYTGDVSGRLSDESTATGGNGRFGHEPSELVGTSVTDTDKPESEIRDGGRTGRGWKLFGF